MGILERAQLELFLNSDLFGHCSMMGQHNFLLVSAGTILNSNWCYLEDLRDYLDYRQHKGLVSPRRDQRQDTSRCF